METSELSSTNQLVGRTLRLIIALLTVILISVCLLLQFSIISLEVNNEPWLTIMVILILLYGNLHFSNSRFNDTIQKYQAKLIAETTSPESEEFQQFLILSSDTYRAQYRRQLVLSSLLLILYIFFLLIVPTELGRIIELLLFLPMAYYVINSFSDHLQYDQIHERESISTSDMDLQ